MQDYQRHLTSQPTETDDFGLTIDMEKENFADNARNAIETIESFRQETPGNIWRISFFLSFNYSYLVAMKSPAPPKRTQGRKRKAAAELEHDAEDHQKQRELQYQSLLAPSSVSIQDKLPEASFSDPVMNSSLPSLPAPEVSQLDSTFQVAPTTPFPNVDPVHHIPEMENMGYQVLSSFIFSALWIRNQ